MGESGIGKPNVPGQQSSERRTIIDSDPPWVTNIPRRNAPSPVEDSLL
jgi:hypothetical protein